MFDAKHALLLIGTIMALFLFGSSCTSRTSRTTATRKKDEVHWSYAGESGPEKWGSLSPEFTLCKQGLAQSPIDIDVVHTASVDLAPIQFDYQPTAVNVVNNGHTVQENYGQGSAIIINDVRYNLLQFHFHDPSEHTLNGKRTAMELHLVHRSDEGELAVVGVLIEEGQANPAFTPIWNNLPTFAGDERHVAGTTINARDLLPTEQSYYHYVGSLTTPPCTEHVQWFVMTEPITASAGQIAVFSSIIKGNNRPVQALNARAVEVAGP